MPQKRRVTPSANGRCATLVDRLLINVRGTHRCRCVTFGRHTKQRCRVKISHPPNFPSLNKQPNTLSNTTTVTNYTNLAFCPLICILHWSDCLFLSSRCSSRTRGPALRPMGVYQLPERTGQLPTGSGLPPTDRPTFTPLEPVYSHCTMLLPAP